MRENHKESLQKKNLEGVWAHFGRLTAKGSALFCRAATLAIVFSTTATPLWAATEKELPDYSGCYSIVAIFIILGGFTVLFPGIPRTKEVTPFKED
ncbi:MAG: hypothetical protein MPJ24_08125 [Pirellulaceae bacterium]|nr:hypothetical protein [Pirellulaceae bacterium]